MNLIKPLLLVLLLLPLVQAHAGEETHDAERARLKEILAGIEESLNNQQMERLLTFFDERAVISFMTTEVAQGREGILAYYNKMFNLPDAPLASYHTKASLDGPAEFFGDTITAAGRTSDDYTLTDGRHYQFNTRWVATAIKRDGDWKVIALDFSVDPFDNVVLDELNRTMLTYLLLAFVAGLALALVASRLLGSKAKGRRV